MTVKNFHFLERGKSSGAVQADCGGTYLTIGLDVQALTVTVNCQLGAWNAKC